MQRASEQQIWNAPKYVDRVVINSSGAIGVVIDINSDGEADDTDQDVNSTEASDAQVGDSVEFSVDADDSENKNVGNDCQNNDDSIEKENEVEWQAGTHETGLEVELSLIKATEDINSEGLYDKTTHGTTETLGFHNCCHIEDKQAQFHTPLD